MIVGLSLNCSNMVYLKSYFEKMTPKFLARLTSSSSKNVHNDGIKGLPFLDIDYHRTNLFKTIDGK